MKRRFFFICLCGLAWGAALPSHAAQPWLNAVGDRTAVCCSPNAAPLVRQAAKRVLAAVQAVQPQAAIQDPDKLAFDYDALGMHHVIVIGQWPDNLLLRTTWGFWANTKAQRDWDARADSVARQMMQLWERNVPAMPWRWQHDLYAFGYGEFDGPDVGYVQTVRSPFPILLRSAPGQSVYDADQVRVKDKFPLDQMYFMIHLTGVGPEGVTRAVDAFLNQGLLNGVVVGNRGAMLKDWSLEGLGTEQLALDLPAWAPTRNLPAAIQYIGQQLPGSHMYGGFMEASGVRPLRCWRLKYRTATGFVFYDSYPTNRASGNELFIAKMASPADAAKAVQGLAKRLGDKAAAREEYVVMQSFSVPDGARVLANAIGK